MRGDESRGNFVFLGSWKVQRGASRLLDLALLYCRTESKFRPTSVVHRTKACNETGMRPCIGGGGDRQSGKTKRKDKGWCASLTSSFLFVFPLRLSSSSFLPRRARSPSMGMGSRLLAPQASSSAKKSRHGKHRMPLSANGRSAWQTQMSSLCG